MTQTIIKYLNKGFSIIPVTKDKNPAIDSWGKHIYSPIPVAKAQSLFKNADGIALLMGGKKKLTTIDIDLKYIGHFHKLPHIFYYCFQFR